MMDQPGHGAGEHQYCTLTVVNLKTLAAQSVIRLAKSEQTFADMTLPKGMCFVQCILRVA